MEKLSNDALEEILSFQEEILDKNRLAISPNESMNVIEDRTFLSFLDALNYTGFVESFDYISWAKERNKATDSVEDAAAEVDEADLEELRKLMTMHIRIERFSEGHIQKLYEAGFFNRFFDRLNKLK